jgi:hypothetical protein
MSEATQTRVSHSFSQRVVGALQLDAAIYEEVEHDPGALGQAALVVLLAAVATALGAPDGQASAGVIGAALGSFAGWAVSAGFVWFVGVRWMKHTSDFQELLRTIGFASAPQIAMILAVVTVLATPVALLVAVWGIAAYVVAVRQALDVTTGRAIFVCLLAFAAKVLTVVALVALVGLLGRG